MTKFSERSVFDALLGIPDKDIERYSIARCIRAQLKGEELKDGIELEAHQELVRRNIGTHKVEGTAIPFDALMPRKQRDLQVNTYSQGGAFVQTQVSSGVIGLLRNRMPENRLGMTVLDGLNGNFAIPRQTGGATAQMLPESSTLTKSTQALDQVILSPHRCGAYTEYTRQLVLQSSISVENFIRDDLTKQISLKLSSMIYTGTGGNSEPLGLLNTPGVQSVVFGGTASWSKVLDFENNLATANADQDGAKIAWVTTPNTRNKLKQIAKTGTGVTSVVPVFIWETNTNFDGGDGAVNGYRAATTNQVPNNLVIFGNWEELILGIWGQGIDLLVNPYSRDVDAAVRMTANVFADVALRHPQSFCISADSGAQ